MNTISKNIFVALLEILLYDLGQVFSFMSVRSPLASTLSYLRKLISVNKRCRRSKIELTMTFQFLFRLVVSMHFCQAKIFFYSCYILNFQFKVSQHVTICFLVHCLPFETYFLFFNVIQIN